MTTTTTIKAIETKYKGYRFRSRLEARWAVFFDHLGIDWRYEEQGYDLGPKLGWYLPDFYLPKYKEWVEIKPQPDGEPPPCWRVYLAGKMDTDWRSKWFGVPESFAGDIWPAPYQAAIPGTRHGYAGPYLMDRGHGCVGEEFHGAEDNEWEHGVITRRADWKQADGGVVERCLDGIDSANIVIAWVESEDCHGTFAELGYATAKKKHVVVAYPKGFDPSPCWFPFLLADRVVAIDEPDPRRLFQQAGLPVWVTEEQEKVATVASQSRGTGYVMYGDPIENMMPSTQGQDHHTPFVVRDKKWEKIESAARAARAARFEHGERG